MTKSEIEMSSKKKEQEQEGENENKKEQEGEPEKEKGKAEEKAAPPPGDTRTLLEQAKVMLFGSKINILLVAAVASFILPSESSSAFIASFLGLIPLATLLGDLTEDIAKRTNDTTAALLNVTFGNLTELIIAIVALQKAQLDLVKYSLVGSVLGNSGLVCASAIIAGGLKKKIVHFNNVAVSTYGNAILLSCLSFVVASTLDLAQPASDSAEVKEQAILNLSRWTSVFLVAVYCSFVYFTQKSHKHLFEAEEELEKEGEEEERKEQEREEGKTEEEIEEEEKKKKEKKQEEEEAAAEKKKQKQKEKEAKKEEEAKKKKKKDEGGVSGILASLGLDGKSDDDDDDDEEDDEPQYSLYFALVALAVVTLAVALLSDILVASVQPACEALHLSRLFVAVVILPIAANVTEHGSALIVAMHGRMDLAIGIALGSAVQIAMFCFPLTVIAGLFIGVPLDLTLPMFLLASLVFQSLLVYTITQAGKGTWLSGGKLLCSYFILCIAFFNAHDVKPEQAVVGAAASTFTTMAPGY